MTEKEKDKTTPETICLPGDGFGGMLGLARRAGRLTTGVAAVIDAVRGRRKPALVLVDETASPAAKSKLGGICHAHRVPCSIIRADGLLGSATGAGTDVLAVAVNDPAFAGRLCALTIPYDPECPAASIHPRQSPLLSPPPER